MHDDNGRCKTVLIGWRIRGATTSIGWRTHHPHHISHAKGSAMPSNIYQQTDQRTDQLCIRKGDALVLLSMILFLS